MERNSTFATASWIFCCQVSCPSRARVLRQGQVANVQTGGCVWKWLVPLNPMVNDHYPYSMAIIGNIPYFQTNPGGWTMIWAAGLHLWEVLWYQVWRRMGWLLCQALKMEDTRMSITWQFQRENIWYDGSLDFVAPYLQRNPGFPAVSLPFSETQLR